MQIATARTVVPSTVPAPQQPTLPPLAQAGAVNETPIREADGMRPKGAIASAVLTFPNNFMYSRTVDIVRGATLATADATGSSGTTDVGEMARQLAISTGSIVAVDSRNPMAVAIYQLLVPNFANGLFRLFDPSEPMPALVPLRRSASLGPANGSRLLAELVADQASPFQWPEFLSAFDENGDGVPLGRAPWRQNAELPLPKLPV